MQHSKQKKRYSRINVDETKQHRPPTRLRPPLHRCNEIHLQFDHKAETHQQPPKYDMHTYCVLDKCQCIRQLREKFSKHFHLQPTIVLIEK